MIIAILLAMLYWAGTKPSLLVLLGSLVIGLVFVFNDTATTEIYTLSLHDALPICSRSHHRLGLQRPPEAGRAGVRPGGVGRAARGGARGLHGGDDAGALRRGGRPP